MSADTHGPAELIGLRTADRATAPAAPPATGPAAVRVHPDDDVAVLIRALPAGSEVEVDGVRVTLHEDVPAGHKVALRALAAGAPVHKYGMPIGAVTTDVTPGTWLQPYGCANACTPSTCPA